jgi:hypothetical protein
VPGYEIMSAWIHEKTYRDGGVGPQNNGNDFWRGFTKAN